MMLPYAVLGVLGVVGMFIIIFLIIRYHRHKLDSLKDVKVMKANSTPSCQYGPVSPGLKETSRENDKADNVIQKQFVAWVEPPCRKVWLSFPTQQESTRRTVQCLAETLTDAGIRCLSALQCHTDIAMNTYERVHILMKSTDLILCCCNEDYKSLWMKTESSSRDKDPDSVFYHECIHINKELKTQQYKHLVIVLLQGASPDCIPDCLQATLPYRFPNERGQFDLIHRIQGSEPNSLQKAAPLPIRDKPWKSSDDDICHLDKVKESEL